MGIVLLLVGPVLVVSAIAVLFGRVTTSRVVARIHVDDLAVGAGPSVCAITGVPTTHRVGVASSEGGVQPWWLLLIFLGPVGWIALAVLVVLGRRPGRVGGVLPISEAAFDRYNAMARTSSRAMVALLAIVVGGLVLLTTLNRSSSVEPWMLVTMAVIAGVALVVGLGASIIAPFRWIDLELDGSGRWVTIQRVHPDYALALQAHNEMTHTRR